MSQQVDVVVVGAGLAGLACALHLSRHDVTVAVLEVHETVGGRVRTDHVDGFTFDHGFQVLNTGYPELPRVVDLDTLDLRPFAATVTLLVDGERVTLGNPLQAPASLPATLRAPVGGLAGRAAVAAYGAGCVLLPTARLKRRPDISSAQAWRRARISPDVVDHVLRPFFSGVLLEQDLTTSRRFTDLMMRMFARGRSTVPAGGMQRLPESIASALPDGTVRTGTDVRRLGADRVEHADGTLTARAVVVAVDPWSARDLLPGLPEAPAARGVSTVYHAAPPFEGVSARLLLDSGESPVANSIALSQAAPEYAPAGRVLVSSSVVAGTWEGDLDGPEVRRALGRLHGTDTSGWEHLATYRVPHALPAMPAPHPLRRPVRVGTGRETVYVAGDHRDTSSLQGALVSGRRAATAVLHDLGASR